MHSNKFIFSMYVVIISVFTTQSAELQSKSYQEFSQGFEASPFQASTVSMNEMVIRFYYIQRLRRAVGALLFLQNKGLLDFSFEYDFGKKDFKFKNQYFFDPVITNALHLSCVKKSAYPLFKVWRSLNDYKYMHSEKIMDEFVGAVICVLQKSIEKHSELAVLHDQLVTKIDKEFSFETMPLEQLLDVLDLLIDEIPHFIEKYELDVRMTWKEWFKRHWFIAPLAFSALALRVYLLYYSGQFKMVRAETL